MTRGAAGGTGVLDVGEGVIRVLLIGCGDVALRTADLLRPRARLYGLTRRPEDATKLRQHGIVPIVGDPDHPPALPLSAAPRTPFNHPICAHRRFSYTSMPLEDARQVRPGVSSLAS